MFNDGVASWITLLFSKTFELFSIKWPGTNFPIWGIMLGATFTVFLIKFLFDLVGSVSIGSISSTYSRGGNNSRIKVSKDRAHDER